MPGPLSTRAGGLATATAPNVEKIPAPPPVNQLPVPLPSLGMLAQADASTCSKRVKVMSQAVVTKGTIVRRTVGDFLGTLKGVVSGTQMDQMSFKAGVAKVKVEGQEVITPLMPTAHNGSSANAPVGMVCAPSQGKVFVLA